MKRINFFSGMPHNYNTRHWHESDSASNHDPLVKLEENVINCINNLNEEIVNLKDIVIKQLQDENEKLWVKCSTLENKVVSLEQNLNSLGQYDRRNNLVLSGIPEKIPDNQLGNMVASILYDIEKQTKKKLLFVVLIENIVKRLS